MRNILFIGMLLTAAFMAGWFKIQRDGENTLIEIDRAAIREDTRQAIEKSREVLDRREQQSPSPSYADTQTPWSPQPVSPWAPPQQPAAAPYPDAGHAAPYPSVWANEYGPAGPYSPAAYSERSHRPPAYPDPAYPRLPDAAPYAPPAYAPPAYAPPAYAPPNYSGQPYSSPSGQLSPVPYPENTRPYTQLPSYRPR